MSRPELAVLRPDDLLTPAVVAKLLGISTKTLARLPIKRLKLGPRMTRYKWSWVEAYIDREAVA